MELDRPMVIALNMMDEVTANGGAVDVNLLESLLGVPVVPISAARNEGIGELVDHALHVARFRERPGRLDFCAPDGPDGGALHRCIHGIANLIEDHAATAHIPVRFAATKLVEGDELVTEALHLDRNELDAIEHIITQMEGEAGTDRLSALADMRFGFIGDVCGRCVVKPHESREHVRSVKIDRILTGRYTAIPAFLVIMGLVFWLTFGVIGAVLQGLMEDGIAAIIASADAGLKAFGTNDVVRSLAVDGVLTGVGSVLTFLPIIVVLFLFLSILEDSGYMARVAFVMDKAASLWPVGPQLRAYARRFWLHRAGYHVDPYAPIRARPQDDGHAHAVHELFGQVAGLRSAVRGILPAGDSSRHGLALSDWYRGRLHCRPGAQPHGI